MQVCHCTAAMMRGTEEVRKMLLGLVASTCTDLHLEHKLPFVEHPEKWCEWSLKPLLAAVRVCVTAAEIGSELASIRCDLLWIPPLVNWAVGTILNCRNDYDHSG